MDASVLDLFNIDPFYLTALGQIILIDLLLSGDNAMVIALACRSLPPRQARIAMICGTAAAIALRVGLTAVAAIVMNISGLKLIGAAALIIIAIKLLLGDDQPDEDDVKSGQSLRSAIMVIVIADAAMSLDNVVAVAAASHGEMSLLVFGLLLSIPLLMIGSVVIGRILQALPLLIGLGAALLGWIAGSIAVADPLIQSWIQSQRPGLLYAAPTVIALFVVLYGWHMRRKPQTPDHILHPISLFIHRIGLVGHGRWLPVAAVALLWVGSEVLG